MKTDKEKFKILLKPGDSEKALAFILGYDKRFKGHRFMWSTGIEVTRTSFDPARLGKSLKTLKESATDALESLESDGHPVTNETLKHRIELIRDRIGWADNELSIWTGKKVEHYHISDNVDKQALRRALDQEILKQRPDFNRVIEKVMSGGANELFGFWQKIIDGKIETKDGKPFAKNTIKAKQQTLEILKRYQEHAKITLTFDDMDMKFYQGFMLWMKTVGKDGKPYDINSRGKNIKDIKAVLNLARTNQYLTHDNFSSWAIPKEKNEVVVLDKAEFLKVCNLELTGTQDHIRDIFVIASFTGARISDFKSFTRENLETENGIVKFKYTQEKTGARCKIPLHPSCLAILDKRNGEFPTMISEQNYRSGLKVIVKSALHDKNEDRDRLKNTIVVKIRGNKEIKALKYDAISPHSARRFFCSSLYYGWFKGDIGWFKEPMPAAFIMRFSGHKTESSFVKYIGSSEAELEARTMEYFNNEQPQMKVS